MKKSIILIVIIFLSVYYSNAQNFDMINPINSKIANLSVNTGVGFAGSKNQFVGYSYIAPSGTYNFNNKLSFDIGFVMMNSTYKGMYVFNGENFSQTNGNLLQNMIYATANYQVSEKLKVSGTVAYGINTFSFNNNKNYTKLKSYSINAEYKVTDKIKINVGFKRGNNENPYEFDNNFRTIP